MILAVTGHRPDKLGGYYNDVYQNIIDVAKKAIRKLKPKKVITGMALGFDQGVADACIQLNIPFIAYVPFESQDCKWPPKSQEKYKSLLKQAEEVKILFDDGYASWKLLQRNEAMVNSCDKVLALYNGTTGGTYACVKYAEKTGKEIINIWKEYIKTEIGQKVADSMVEF